MAQDRIARHQRVGTHAQAEDRPGPAGEGLGGFAAEALSPEDQLGILREFLAADVVRDRPPGVQRHHDELIRLCVESGDLALGMGLWALMGLRVVGAAPVAAGLLMSLLAQLEEEHGLGNLAEQEDRDAAAADAEAELEHERSGGL